MSSSKPIVNGNRSHYDLSSSTFVEHLSSLPIVATAASTAYQYPPIENVSKTVQSGVNKVLSYTYDTPIAAGLSKADGFATNVLDGLSDRVPIIKAPLGEISKRLGLTYLFNVVFVCWTQFFELLTKLKDIFAPLLDPILSPLNHLLEKFIQSWLPSSTTAEKTKAPIKPVPKSEFDRFFKLLLLAVDRIKTRTQPWVNHIKKNVSDIIAVPGTFYDQNLAVYVDGLRSRTVVILNHGKHFVVSYMHVINNYGSSVYYHIAGLYSANKPKENAPLADYVLAIFKTVESLLKEVIDNGKKKAHDAKTNAIDGSEGQTNGLIGGVKGATEAPRKRVNANGVPA